MERNEVIQKIVEIYAKKADLTDEQKIEKCRYLESIDNPNQFVDVILKNIDQLSKEGKLNPEEIQEVFGLLLELDLDDFKSLEDLEQRLGLIDYGFSFNGELIEEMLIEFNKLVSPSDIDCFFTGAAIMWLANGYLPERFHSDLDLLVNEEQLGSLKRIVDGNNNFHFRSNMKKKEGKSSEPWKINETSHEYVIEYKDSSIGLFLFSRDQENRITSKQYYTLDGRLVCDEEQFSKKFSELAFPDDIAEYKGIRFRHEDIAEIIRRKQLRGKKLDNKDIERISKLLGPERFGEVLARVEELKVARQSNCSRRTQLDCDGSIIGRMEMRI